MLELASRRELPPPGAREAQSNVNLACTLLRCESVPRQGDVSAGGGSADCIEMFRRLQMESAFEAS